jgi:5-methylcytosine-specific restriction protein A
MSDGEKQQNVFLLTWSPLAEPMSEDQLERIERDVSVGRPCEITHWSVGGRTTLITPGDHFYFFRQRIDRGLIAHGTIQSEPRPGRRSSNGAEGTFCDITFDSWLSTHNRLSIEEVKAKIPGHSWDVVRRPGQIVPAKIAKELDDLWAVHLGAAKSGVIDQPDEVPAGDYVDGATTQVLVNRFERNPKARSECIKHYGAICSVCDFDFSEAYGPIGEGRIHVHHLKELSEVKHAHLINPIKDLRPVCPNCHMMLHSTRPALSIDELKKHLRNG